MHVRTGRLNRFRTGLVLLSSALTWCGACDRASPPAPSGGSSAAPATAPPSATLPADDQHALRDFVQSSGQRSDLRPAAGGSPGDSLPPGHPPIPPAGSSSGVVMPPGGGANVALKLDYDVPATWEEVPPASSMRRAQYRLPRAAGDAEDGELAVFDASIGGTVKDNMDRWRSQLVRADGQPVPEADAPTETIDVGKLRVTLLDASGRYSPTQMMPGAPSSPPREDFRLLGAVVETPQGNWYFKAAGPRATMAQHREAFLAMIRSVRQ
jgi:hypothetical protein